MAWKLLVDNARGVPFKLRKAL